MERESVVEPRKLKRYLPKRLILLILFFVLLLAFLVAPWALGRSGLAAQFLGSKLSTESMAVDLGSINFGWMKPTQIREISVKTRGGSLVELDTLTCDLSLLEWLMSGFSRPLDIYGRKATVRSSIEGGEIRLLKDLETLQEGSVSNENVDYRLDMKEISVVLEDRDRQKLWQANQASASVTSIDQLVTLTVDGVVTDPLGFNGSVNCTFTKASESEPESLIDDSWKLDLSLDSLPVSSGRLFLDCFTGTDTTSPDIIAGDVSGHLVLAFDGQEETTASFSNLQLSDLQVRDDSGRPWRQQLIQIDGGVTITGSIFTSNNLKVSTDFGNASFHLSMDPSKSTNVKKRFAQNALHELVGDVEIDIDLPSFQKSVSWFLPLRNDTELKSGRLYGTATTDRIASSKRTTINVTLDSFQATTETGDTVALAPNSFNATFEHDEKNFRAENLTWISEFGSASGEGDLRQGECEFEVNLSKIANTLGQVFNLKKNSLSGISEGSVRWISSGSNDWSLSGVFNAENVVVKTEDLPSIEQSSIHGEINAAGRWGDGELEELIAFTASANSDDMTLTCRFVPQESETGLRNKSRFHWTSQGELGNFTQLAKYLSASRVNNLTGKYRFEADSIFSDAEILITESSAEISKLSAKLKDFHFQQPLVQLTLAGRFDRSSSNWIVHDFTVSSHSVSARAHGKKQDDRIEYEVQWRTLLNRLLASITENPIPALGSTSSLDNDADRNEKNLQKLDEIDLRGDGEGTLVAKCTKESSQYELDFHVTDLSIPHLDETTADTTSLNTNRNTLQSIAPELSQQEQWVEPSLRILSIARVRHGEPKVVIDQLEVSTNWIQSSLKGELLSESTSHQLKLHGTCDWNMDQFNPKIQSLLPLKVNLRGLHHSDLNVTGVFAEAATNQLTLETSLGWTSAEFAGIEIESAVIPVTLENNTVYLNESKLPVGEGWVNFSGSIRQIDDSTWMEINPGSIVNEVAITPKMSKQWLRFIAPLIADATEIDGNVGITLDEAKINLSDPSKTKVDGRLKLDTIRLSAGPFTSQLIQTVQQVRSLSEQPLDPSLDNRARSTIMKIPEQSVSFAVANQIVAHDRLQVELDRAQLITTGQVSFNSELNLTVAVPLDPNWLGKDLEPLAGQTLYLPVRGSLERPIIDGTNLQAMIRQLGIQAIQNNAENFLEDQINRGLEKLFGK